VQATRDLAKFNASLVSVLEYVWQSTESACGTRPAPALRVQHARVRKESLVFSYPHCETAVHRVGPKLQDRPDGDVLSLGQYHTVGAGEETRPTRAVEPRRAPHYPTPPASFIEVEVRVPEVRLELGRDSSVSSGAETRDQKKAEGIRFCRAYPGRPRGEIEGPGGRREGEGSGWRLNEARGGTNEERGRQPGNSELASDDQRRKGERKESSESTQGVPNQSASCAGENIFTTTDIP
jgi:hypothetical protein